MGERETVTYAFNEDVVLAKASNVRDRLGDLERLADSLLARLAPSRT